MTKPENRGASGTHPLDHSFTPNPEGVAERLGGDELGSRVATHYAPEIGLRRFLHGLRGGFFWEMLEGQLNDCDAVMAEHGWHRTIEQPGRFPGDRNALPYSDLWYAGTIGALCWMVLDWRGKGELPEVALSRIMEIGLRAREWEWRGRYKGHIVRGDKTLKAARAGAQGRRGAMAGDTEKRLAEMRRLLRERPEMSVSWAATTAFTHGLGGSAKSNRALWYRHRPK